MFRRFNRRMFLDWRGYLIGIALVALFTILLFSLLNIITSVHAILVYTLPIILTAIYSGLGASIFTSIISLLVYDYFFIEPLYTIGPRNAQDIPVLVVFFFVGMIISFLASDLRQKTEEATRDKETLQLRAAILDKANDAIILRDLNHTILYTNEAASELYGYSREEFIGMNVHSLIAPQEEPLYEERTRTILEKGEFRAEVFHIRKDKSVIPVEAHSHRIKIGQGEYILSLVRDITARKQAEDNLRQSEMQLGILFNAMKEGVSLISPEGIVIKTNKAELEIFGHQSFAEVENHYYWKEVVQHLSADGNPLSPGESVVARAFREKKAIANVEQGFIKPDGTVLWLSMTAIPIINNPGEVTAVVRTFMDITEAKKIREERENFTKQLLKAQEEERKHIARELHDDASPSLAYLGLEVDNLITRYPMLPEETIKQLKGIREKLDTAQQDLRRFSHELHPSILDNLGLDSALESLIDEVNSKRNMNIEFEITGTKRDLSDDIKLTLYRITQEALNNVWKHSRTTEAAVYLEYYSDRVKLSITDNGTGFDPAKQTKGLGLTSMRERAKLIGAELKIESQPGKGAAAIIEVKL